MGSCAAPSAKGDDKFITTDYLQQCPSNSALLLKVTPSASFTWLTVDFTLAISCARSFSFTNW
ncbi:hypothetical protein GQJ06_004843 [Salmonella enterica subsp. enterica serovar Dublin]|nr:hypothetical protein [Salmonella enterica subsp. enterica serovar Dublin]